jgi:hypothetical protein
MEFTAKVYFDEILQDNKDISNLLENFKLSIKRESSFTSGENILRESSDLAFDVKGCSYDYLCSKFTETPCDDVKVYFELTIHGELLTFNGLIRLSSISWLKNKKIATIKAIKDNSFSGYIRDFTDIEVDLSNVKSYLCEDINISYLLLNTPTTPNTYTIDNVKIYDVLDVLNYLVTYFSSDVLSVKSDYFFNNKYAITTGYNLHNKNYNNQKAFPKVSINSLISELRKKFAIYTAVEYEINGTPYLRIEHETYFFDDIEILDNNELPFDLKTYFDIKKVFNEIKVGSNDVKLIDVELPTMPQKNLIGWSKESKTNCGGCSGVKNSQLDLISDYIIDGNLIHEAMNQVVNVDYEKDDNIFLLNYYFDGFENKLVGNNTSIYNININNENVLNRFVGVGNSCIKTNGELKYAFYIDEEITGFPNNNAVFIKGTNGFLCGSRKKNFITSTALWFDNFPSLTTFFNGTAVGGCDEVLSIDPDAFLCNEAGIYKFKSKLENILQVLSLGQTQHAFNVTHELHILVYSDNTLTTQLFDYFDSEFVVDGVNPANLEIVTPDINLNVGNIVFVYLKSFTQIVYPFDDFTFEYDKISFESIATTCTTIPDNLDLFKPYVVEYSRPLNACDYNKLKANPKGYINIDGNKCYIEEVNYSLQKTNFKLITNKLIC